MSLVYQSNVLIGTTKVGTIKPDANGYYEVVLGAMNVDNSAGAFYPLEPVKALLLQSSDLMRRINDRALRSEYGHPRKENMKPMEFLARVMDIREDKTCNHIMSIELDEKRVIDKDTGLAIAAMIGRIYPSGPYGEVLEKQLKNPEENVCYSIRSITNDRYDHTGKLIKEIKQIVTWDYVNEPGIRFAKKYYSPSVESHQGLILPEDKVVTANDYVSFDEETILKARDYARTNGIGTESMETLFDELLTQSRVTTPYGTFYKKPTFSKWGK